VRKQPITGTIVGIFAGALDGVHAQLIRKISWGYTAELLESKGAFHQGDRVHLSVREFIMNKAAWRRDLAEGRRVEMANGAAARHPNGHRDLRLHADPLLSPPPVERSPASLPCAPPQTPALSPASRVRDTSAVAQSALYARS